MAEEGLFYCLAEGIIERLDPQAVKKSGLFWCVKDLEKLEIIVSKIKVLLLNVDRRQQRDQAHAIREWLLEIADAFYELDDLLDDFSTKVLQKENVAPDNMKKEEVKNVRKRFNAYYSYPSKVNTALVQPRIQFGLLAYLLLFITLFNKKVKEK